MKDAPSANPVAKFVQDFENLPQNVSSTPAPSHHQHTILSTHLSSFILVLIVHGSLASASMTSWLLMLACGHTQVTDTFTGFGKHLVTQAANGSYYMEQFKGFLHKLRDPVAVCPLYPFCSAKCMHPVCTRLLSIAILPL